MVLAIYYSMSTNRINKTAQRKQALTSDFFEDCTSFDKYILGLQSRGDKTRAEWKTDKRLAHSLLKRARIAKSERVATLGTTSGLALAKNARLDNRTFTVCQVKTNALDYSPIYRNLGGTPENEFTERFKKERYVLDKQCATRRKN